MLSHPRHSQGYLTAGMLHAEGFPCLTIKAHNGRLMLVFLDLCLATYIRSTQDAGGTPSSEVVNASLATRRAGGTWRGIRLIRFTIMASVFWERIIDWGWIRCWPDLEGGSISQSFIWCTTYARIWKLPCLTAGTFIVSRTKTTWAWSNV